MDNEVADFLRYCRLERRLADLTCKAYERDVLQSVHRIVCEVPIPVRVVAVRDEDLEMLHRGYSALGPSASGSTARPNVREAARLGSKALLQNGDDLLNPFGK